MLVTELMSKFPHVVEATQTIRHAADVMANHNVGALPVRDNGRLAGIVTDRDLAVRAIARGISPEDAVRTVMTESPITIAPNASADEALQSMVQHGVGRLCVVDGTEIKGIVTFGDLSALTRLVADGLARSESAGA